jgi:hypothetical protein
VRINEWFNPKYLFIDPQDFFAVSSSTHSLNIENVEKAINLQLLRHT